jgi:putative ABC transport system permease protein
MSLRTRIAGGFRALVRSRQDDADLDDELRQYVEAAVGHKMAEGLSREAATRAARAEVGSPEAVKDWMRDVGWESRVESLWQDVRLAFRMLRREPRFTIATVLPLALGIGAAVAVYSVAYGILLRPLPVHDEPSLVVGYVVRAVQNDAAMPYPRFQAWRDSGVFEGLAASTSRSFDIVTDGVAERVQAAAVAGDFFHVLGVAAVRGRVLSVDDKDAEGIPAVISHSLWTRRFAGDTAVLGRTISAGSYQLTIVGIAPPAFERWRGEAHIWVPVERVHSPAILASHGYHLFTPIGRLHEGLSRAATEERLATVDGALRDSLDGSRVPPARLVSLRDDVVAPGMRRTLFVLLAAVALTWLVVCANVANLLLARGTRRASDLAVRLAIGADRWRIVRQLLVESLVLAVPAGALGALLAYWGVQSLVSFGPPGLIGNAAIRVDLPILLLAVGAILLSALAFGLAPALRLSRVSLQAVLTERAAPRRASGVLIAAQVVVAVVVLTAAALLVKSFARMTAVELGFEPRDVLTVQFSFPQKFPGSPESQRHWQFAAQEALVSRLGALPGVVDVSLALPVFRPATDQRWSVALDDGRRFLNGEAAQRPFAPRPHTVGPGFFRVYGGRIVEGRDFNEHDRYDSPRVVLVNETMARMHWPGESPLGRRLNFGSYSLAKKEYDEPWHEIVGVVADIRYGGVEEPFLPDVYRTATQHPLWGGYAVLKTTVKPEELGTMALAAIRAIDPEIPTYAARTLQDLVDESTAMTRYNSALLSICAALTTLLCGFGLYSMLAYAVAARRRELGIRIALGAGSRRMIAGVLRQALWPLASGLAVGLVAAWFATQVLAGALYEVSPRDPLAFGGAAVVVAALSLIAAWIPAARAARVDPVQALKV